MRKNLASMLPVTSKEVTMSKLKMRGGEEKERVIEGREGVVSRTEEREGIEREGKEFGREERKKGWWRKQVEGRVKERDDRGDKEEVRRGGESRGE